MSNRELLRSRSSKQYSAFGFGGEPGSPWALQTAPGQDALRVAIIVGKMKKRSELRAGICTEKDITLLASTLAREIPQSTDWKIDHLRRPRNIIASREPPEKGDFTQPLG